MVDEYVEYSDAPGCFARLKDSIAKVGIGILMIIISFPLLFWNEGRAVKRAQDLEFGRGSVQEIKADGASAAKAGSLYHLTGDVTVKKPAKDTKFSVESNAVSLARTVEMYQWKEDKKTEKSGDKNKTTYSYAETWSETAISSSGFKKSGYDNPPMPFKSDTFVSADVMLGSFKVGGILAGKWSADEDLSVKEKDVANFGTANSRKPQLHNGGIYFGDPGSPAIGDVRVTYKHGPVGPGSVVAGFESGTLVPFTHAEMYGKIAMMSKGTKSADEMFQDAEDANVMLTWGLRLLGFILMFAGFNLLFGPIDTIVRMIPIIGGVIDFGTTVISGLLAFALSFITIAIGWIFYRPLIGILLLAIGMSAIGLMVFLGLKAKKKNG